uniref:hypothetical protein n=1 Tax=Hydrogenophaga sp. OTU3427 TaxID=3043856 RepID=UPI00313ED9E1
DGEGDTATAQLVITVAPDSTPTVDWVLANGGPAVVDEGALPDGNLGGTTSTSGTLDIATGGDTLNAVGGVDINGVDVTAGGTVPGTYGDLVVTVSGGVYSWTYTLNDNAPHTDPTAVGSADQFPEENFAVVVKDDDGDVAPPVNLQIQINDDGPVDVTPDATVVDNAAGATSGPVALDLDGLVTDNYGADGAGTVYFAPSLDGASAEDRVTGSPLTSSGLPITYSLSVDGSVLTASTALGTVFTVTIDAAASTYVVQMVGTVDGGAPVIDFNGGGYNFQGGNVSWAGFNTVADDNSHDILLTPLVGGVSGGTVNTNANAGGISGGASVGAGEAMRVDFVVDLTGAPVSGGSFASAANQTQNFDGHYTVNGATAVFGVGGSASNTTSVTVKAYDDADTGAIKNVGDGAQDDIVAVSITQGGSQLLVLAADGTSQTVVVGGTSYTTSFDASGSVTVSGMSNGTALGVYTADGYNSLEYAYTSGSNFQIGDFGTTAITPGEPVDLGLPVVIEDGDGDTATGEIGIQLEPLSIGGGSGGGGGSSGGGGGDPGGRMAASGADDSEAASTASATVSLLSVVDGDALQVVQPAVDGQLATEPLSSVSVTAEALNPADLLDDPAFEVSLPVPAQEVSPGDAHGHAPQGGSADQQATPGLDHLPFEVPGADSVGARLIEAHAHKPD